MSVEWLVDISITQELCHKKNHLSSCLMPAQHLKTHLLFSCIVTVSENRTYQFQLWVQNWTEIGRAVPVSARHARSYCIMEHSLFRQLSYALVSILKIFEVASMSNHSSHQLLAENFYNWFPIDLRFHTFCKAKLLTHSFSFQHSLSSSMKNSYDWPIFKLQCYLPNRLNSYDGSIKLNCNLLCDQLNASTQPKWNSYSKTPNSPFSFNLAFAGLFNYSVLEWYTRQHYSWLDLLVLSFN